MIQGITGRAAISQSHVEVPVVTKGNLTPLWFEKGCGCSSTISSLWKSPMSGFGVMPY